MARCLDLTDNRQIPDILVEVVLEARLKQRLVGAVVLISLAVIFLPMLLDGGGRYSEEVELPARVPPQPIPVEPTVRLEESAWPSPVVEVSPDDAGKVTELPLPEPEMPAPEPVAARQPVKAAEPAPAAVMSTNPPLEGWAVQTGSFGESGNANAERDRLRKAGFPAFVATAEEDGKKRFRVRVGPELDRGRAEKLRDRLAREQKLDGLVISHP